MDRTSVLKYEAGTVWPPFEVLVSLAAELSVSLDWLCGLSADPHSKTGDDSQESEGFAAPGMQSGLP
jgi:transcriptional regulator with XRE-family HTH domain